MPRVFVRDHSGETAVPGIGVARRAMKRTTVAALLAVLALAARRARRNAGADLRYAARPHSPCQSAVAPRAETGGRRADHHRRHRLVVDRRLRRFSSPAANLSEPARRRTQAAFPRPSDYRDQPRRQRRGSRRHAQALRHGRGGRQARPGSLAARHQFGHCAITSSPITAPRSATASTRSAPSAPISC